MTALQMAKNDETRAIDTLLSVSDPYGKDVTNEDDSWVKVVKNGKKQKDPNGRLVDSGLQVGFFDSPFGGQTCVNLSLILPLFFCFADNGVLVDHANTLAHTYTHTAKR